MLGNRNYFFTVPVPTLDKLRFRFLLLTIDGSSSGSVLGPSDFDIFLEIQYASCVFGLALNSETSL